MSVIRDFQWQTKASESALVMGFKESPVLGRNLAGGGDLLTRALTWHVIVLHCEVTASSGALWCHALFIHKGCALPFCCAEETCCYCVASTCLFFPPHPDTKLWHNESGHCLRSALCHGPLPASQKAYWRQFRELGRSGECLERQRKSDTEGVLHLLTLVLSRTETTSSPYLQETGGSSSSER